MTLSHKCANCGGDLLTKVIMYDQHWGDEVVFFEDVPAQVCVDCDYVWIEGPVLEKMDQILTEHPKPKRMKEVPVWSLSA